MRSYRQRALVRSVAIGPAGDARDRSGLVSGAWWGHTAIADLGARDVGSHQATSQGGS